MLGKGWEFQWCRVQLRMAQVRAAYVGHDGGTIEACDAVLSFFEALHHLRDWLGNDKSSGISKSDADDFIRGSAALRMCGDLANGSKHLVLDRNPWTGDGSTEITRSDVTISVSEGAIRHAFYVQSGGESYDVLQVAETAVQEWTSFLTSRGLL